MNLLSRCLFTYPEVTEQPYHPFGGVFLSFISAFALYYILISQLYSPVFLPSVCSELSRWLIRGFSMKDAARCGPKVTV